MEIIPTQNRVMAERFFVRCHSIGVNYKLTSHFLSHNFRFLTAAAAAPLLTARGF